MTYFFMIHNERYVEKLFFIYYLGNYLYHINIIYETHDIVNMV